MKVADGSNLREEGFSRTLYARGSDDQAAVHSAPNRPELCLWRSYDSASQIGDRKSGRCRPFRSLFARNPPEEISEEGKWYVIQVKGLYRVLSHQPSMLARPAATYVGPADIDARETEFGSRSSWLLWQYM